MDEGFTQKDLDGYLSYKAMLEEMDDEMRAEYWKSENRRANLYLIQQLHDSIEQDESIILNTQRWMKGLLERVEDMELLKKYFTTGAELIQGCGDSILITRAEIAHYIKYPLYSEKMRQWYRTKEGQQWQAKILKQLKTK